MPALMPGLRASRPRLLPLLRCAATARVPVAVPLLPGQDVGGGSGSSRRGPGRGSFELASAAAAAAAIGAGCWASTAPAKLEERPAYEPPPRLGTSFSSLPRSMPADEAGQLAWSVKNLEVDRVRQLLKKWPHGATLLDSEDNTLFHLAARQPARCAAQPGAATELIKLLLQEGWEVVDLKNSQGERAELVAAREDPNGPARLLLRARSYDFQEKSRAEVPLLLVGEESPVPWKWQYLLQDEQRRCWAGVLPNAFPPEQCEEWLQIATEEGNWQRLPGVPRKVAWYVDAEFADTPYRYSGLEYTATVFPPWMEEIRREVCTLCGIPPERYPNSCNVNIYPDNTGEVGWHSDDEVMFRGIAGDTRIISFSLGASRDFCWRLQGTADTIGCAPLGNGDIMTMEGLFQKHYKHAVPASDVPCGPRINFTFRWVVVKAHAADAETKATVV